MHILQLTSDWKWTGPAAPMLELLLALRERGHEVWLACPPPPPNETGLAARAREAGAAPELSLARGRGVRWWRDAADARRLREFCAARGVEIVHAWHTRDHVLGLRASAQRRRERAAALVRSVKSAEPIAATPWNRWLYGPGSDGLLCVSPGAARRNAPLRGGRPLAGAFGAVDPVRFQPAPRSAALAAELGLARRAARAWGSSRARSATGASTLLLEAHARVSRAADPDARLLVIGRGTHIEETAREPARRLGIADRVVFAGYRGDDYADVLRLCDVVHPAGARLRRRLPRGARGRGVRHPRGHHAARRAAGDRAGRRDRPARRRAAREPGAALGALLADPVRRARMGRAARERALACFTPARLAEAAERLYRRGAGSLVGRASPVCSATSSRYRPPAASSSLVGAGLRHAPVLEHEDAVGAPHRGEPVRDHEHGAARAAAPRAPAARCARSASRASEVASSRIRIAGSRRIARAMVMRWRCPPESRVPPTPTSRVVALRQGLRELVDVRRARGLAASRPRSRRGGRSGCSRRCCRRTGRAPASPPPPGASSDVAAARGAGRRRRSRSRPRSGS